MSSPCKNCDQKSINWIVETLSPGCNHPCAQFNEFADDLSNRMTEMIGKCQAIIDRHKEDKQ